MISSISKPFDRLFNSVFLKSFLYGFGFLVCMGSTAYGQEKDKLDTEVVNIVKPYSPEVSDAFKVKETPITDESVETRKKEVSYGIFSVPVASTFEPDKGQAAEVERPSREPQFDNYVTLGFGNYTTILGELFSNVEINDTDNAGFFFRHNSSQGNIDGVRIENKFYDTKLDANYASRQRGLAFEVNGGFEHGLYNWYGLPPFLDGATNEFLAAIDPQQTHFSAYIGGNVAVEDSFFDWTSFRLRHMSDAFSSSEVNLILNPEFSFPINDLLLKIDGDLDYLDGEFDRNYFNTGAIDYGFLNIGVTPSIVYVDDELTLSIGAGLYMASDTANNDTEFFIYPRIKASYRVVDEVLIAYGGAEGDLKQNSYYGFKDENPFVSPTLNIAPTSQLYNVFAGIKGKASNAVGYNIRASYGKDENRALFQANPYKGLNSDFEGYERGNSFGVVYDDINILSLFGELIVDVNEDFSMGLSGTFNSFDTTNQAAAWNLPEVEASIFSNFNITEQIYGGVSIFFVGERSDLLINAQPFEESTTQINLDSFIDANVHAGYKFNDRLNFFLKASNLVGKNYERWLNFPVQGIQGLLGATYKFDW